MVIVKEAHGPQFFYCTDVNANVCEIIEAFADRSAIEQMFHDVKEVWGRGQQQVRNVWANIACWHLNLWLFTLVELWAWKKTAKQLTRRDDSPWEVNDVVPYAHADQGLAPKCRANPERRPMTCEPPVMKKLCKPQLTPFYPTPSRGTWHWPWRVNRADLLWPEEWIEWLGVTLLAE